MAIQQWVHYRSQYDDIYKCKSAPDAIDVHLSNHTVNYHTAQSQQMRVGYILLSLCSIICSNKQIYIVYLYF